jgi:hypothetical protein
MLLNKDATEKLANDLAFELWDAWRTERDGAGFVDGIWTGIYHLLHAQAVTANAIDGVSVEPHKVREFIEEQTRAMFAHLFPHDDYPEDED